MKGCINHNNTLYNSNIFTISKLEMGCYHMRCLDSYAISEMISLIMILLISTGGITAITIWGVPYMENQKVAVRWESALLQLDVMGDIIEDVFSEGINSSKKMNFQTSEGEFLYDAQGGRFVIYYPVYTDYDARTYEVKRFSFSVQFTDDTENFKFYLNRVFDDHSGWNLEFTATRLDGSVEAIWQTSIPAIGIPGTVTVGPFPANCIKDAVRIDIVCTDGGANSFDYGRIWLFDVGTLIHYTAPIRSESNRVIIENGAVISAHSDNGYMYNEPAYWSQTLLDDSVLMTMRIIQMRNDEAKGVNISGFGSFQSEFMINASNSTTQQNRESFGYPIKIKIYGDEAAVYAWYMYYKNRMDFEEGTDGFSEKILRMNDKYEPDADRMTMKDLYFSLNHAIYNIGMEVK